MYITLLCISCFAHLCQLLTAGLSHIKILYMKRLRHNIMPCSCLFVRSFFCAGRSFLPPCLISSTSPFVLTPAMKKVAKDKYYFPWCMLLPTYCNPCHDITIVYDTTIELICFLLFFLFTFFSIRSIVRHTVKKKIPCCVGTSVSLVHVLSLLQTVQLFSVHACLLPATVAVFGEVNEVI